MILQQTNSNTQELRRNEKYLLDEIENLKSQIVSKNNELSSVKEKNESLEEKYKIKFEGLEENLKDRYINRETKLKQESQEEISKIKSENQTLKISLEQIKYESKIKEEKLHELFANCEEKKIENERMIDNKNQEYENLLNNIKSVKKEMEYLEKLSEEKSNEFRFENEMLQGEIAKLSQILQLKDDEIKNKTSENLRFLGTLEERHRAINEMELSLKKKDNLILKLKADINSLNHNIVLLEEKKKANEKSIEKLKEQLEEYKIKIENDNKDIIDGEKKKLLFENDELFRKIHEMDKYTKSIKKEFDIERSKILGISNKKIKFVLNERDETYRREVQSLENINKDKQKQIDEIILKYNNKKYRVKLFFYFFKLHVG